MTLPQVAFSGRSNVGKSSLINMLLRRTRNKIAHVSATPGKTQALNFYKVNDDFFLVDLPGYGYARVPQATRDSWAELIEWYLGESGLARGVVHLVDARHPPTRHDHRMVEYLAELGLPTLIVLTKIDKLKRMERERSMARAAEALQVDEAQLVAFSSKTRRGTGGPARGARGARRRPRGPRVRPRASVAALAASVALTACTIAPGPAGPAGAAGSLPSGYGTLRQEDVSLTLATEDVRLMVTPLDESVVRVTAPDTERRLSGLVAAHALPGESDGHGLFLVQFFSDRPDIRFEPDEVQLTSQGFRMRPAAIIPLTPSWGEHRLRQREPEMAIYRFGGSIDLESDLVLSYGLRDTSQWGSILPRVQAERARVRSRAAAARP